MGRPDLKAVRTEEILAAFERCVARFGLHGSSLERIAESAGMKRSVVRHYLGNRDVMVEALAERVADRCREDLDAYLSTVSEKRRMDQLLAFLFPDSGQGSTDNLMAVESLIAAGEDHPRIRELMTTYVEAVVGMVADQLRLAFPNTVRSHCWSTAYGLVGICFNHASLSPLGLPTKYLKAARNSARELINTLQP